MTPRALLLPLLALALSGCLSTRDEPFPLDGGDSVAAKPGDYACRTVEAGGAAKVERGRLVRLRRAGRTQYVFLAPDNSEAEPATLHRAAGDDFLVAVAHADEPGEDLYLAAVPSGGGSFRLYAPTSAALAAAPALAERNGASLAHDQFSDDLSGPVDRQRAFALGFAADRRNWRLTADCQRR